MISGALIRCVPVSADPANRRYVGTVSSSKTGRRLYVGNTFDDPDEALNEAKVWFRENEASISKKLRFE